VTHLEVLTKVKRSDKKHKTILFRPQGSLSFIELNADLMERAANHLLLI
jgi:hypothetical protein